MSRRTTPGAPERGAIRSDWDDCEALLTENVFYAALAWLLHPELQDQLRAAWMANCARLMWTLRALRLVSKACWQSVDGASQRLLHTFQIRCPPRRPAFFCTLSRHFVSFRRAVRPLYYSAWTRLTMDYFYRLKWQSNRNTNDYGIVVADPINKWLGPTVDEENLLSIITALCDSYEMFLQEFWKSYPLDKLDADSYRQLVVAVWRACRDCRSNLIIPQAVQLERLITSDLESGVEHDDPLEHYYCYAETDELMQICQVQCADAPMCTGLAADLENKLQQPICLDSQYDCYIARRVVENRLRQGNIAVACHGDRCEGHCPDCNEKAVQYVPLARYSPDVLRVDLWW